jgi:hypothetical protein
MGKAKRDGVAAPFAVSPLFLFPLDVQIHRTADNYQTQHDGQYRFQLHQKHLLILLYSHLYIILRPAGCWQKQ